MSSVKLCLFAATPDLADLPWAVRVLIGTPEELAERAVAWGYDGIELMPNPDRMPDPGAIEKILKKTGAAMPVVSSAVIFFQGLALLHRDPGIRRRAIDAFKRILDFAGCSQAKVGLGASRGSGILGASPEEMEIMANEIFRELAEHAEKAGSIIMLEAAEPGYSKFINTMNEARTWVERIGSPFFSLMLDTYQLAESEVSFEAGVRAARGTAHHIHLYDPSHLPPGVVPEKSRYDWPDIARILKQENFHGSGSICLVPEGDPEAAGRKSATYLRRLFDRVDV